MGGILGLGSAGSQGLSSEMIEKLKEAEREATVAPIEKEIEDWDLEVEEFAEFEAAMNELYQASKLLDLYNLDGNAFESVYASTTGTSASFEAADTSGLNPGTIAVEIKQLAEKSIYSSGAPYSETEKDAKMGPGFIYIELADGTTVPFATDGRSLEDLVKEMNYNSKIDASIEKVGNDEYKLIIKSQESGTANAIIGITGDHAGSAIATNLTETREAKDLKATIDGIDYTLPSNTVPMSNGLTIQALEVGDSSITISRDTTAVQTAMQAMVDAYNNLNALVTEYSYGGESNIEDTQSLRSMLDQVKNLFFGSTFGDTNTGKDLNVFSYGISISEYGNLVLDAAEFDDAVKNNYEEVKAVLIGVAENKGIGTQLKELIDDFNSMDGLLTSYGDEMIDRLDRLNKEKNEAIEDLDYKYDQLTAQFVAYTSIITEFENSFSALSMMISQSQASK